MKIEKLKKFRQTAYQLLGNGKDATMDLMDAVLVTRSVYSFAELSLSPVFRACRIKAEPLSGRPFSHFEHD